MDSMNFHSVERIRITRDLFNVEGNDLYIIKIIARNERGAECDITFFSDKRVEIEIKK